MNIDFNHESVFLTGLPHPVSSNQYVGKRYAPKQKAKYLNDFSNWMAHVGIQDRRRVVRFVFGENLTAFQKRKAIGVVKISYLWATNFKTKAGTMKMIDASNHMKLTEDCLAKFLTIDDCYFKEFTWDTIHSEVESSFSVNIYRARIIDGKPSV